MERYTRRAAMRANETAVVQASAWGDAEATRRHDLVVTKRIVAP